MRLSFGQLDFLERSEHRIIDHLFDLEYNQYSTK